MSWRKVWMEMVKGTQERLAKGVGSIEDGRRVY